MAIEVFGRDYPLGGFLLLAILYAMIKYFNSTDTPKIKGIPEIPGVPIFGNLLQLGNEHAKRAAALAKKYGPVFQVRLGNRVCRHLHAVDKINGTH